MSVTRLQKCGFRYTYTSYNFQQKPILKTRIDNKNNHDT